MYICTCTRASLFLPRYSKENALNLFKCSDIAEERKTTIYLGDINDLKVIGSDLFRAYITQRKQTVIISVHLNGRKTSVK